MPRGKIAILILNEMQVLDQKIATARPIGKKPTDFDQCLWIDLTSFRGTGGRRRPSRPVGLLKVGCSIALIYKSPPTIKIPYGPAPTSPSDQSSDREFLLI